MKKKNGFTLAEVLITLAIIGVVATLTLPALMTNIQEQEGVTGLRKATNTLIEAATMNAAVNGFSYNDLGETLTFGASNAIYGQDGNVSQTLYGILGANANIDARRSTATEIVFRDGTSVLAGGGGACNANNALGRIRAYAIIVDTNGPKSPNVTSTCNGNCGQKTNRQIRDRFAMCIGGSDAWGGNSAAEWALGHHNAGAGSGS